MTDEQNVIAADTRFFDALIQANGSALDQILVEDFILVDVLSGGVIEKAVLVPLVASGRLTFEQIQADPTARRVRFYGTTGVIVGRTQMSGRYEGMPWSASSRYTHVFVADQGEWRLASAQGTPITEAP